ncbi:MAG: hypothetical protein D6769_02915, partial [Methanobacteriota archaeon]
MEQKHKEMFATEPVLQGIKLDDFNSMFPEEQLASHKQSVFESSLNELIASLSLLGVDSSPVEKFNNALSSISPNNIALLAQLAQSLPTNFNIRNSLLERATMSLSEFCPSTQHPAPSTQHPA